MSRFFVDPAAVQGRYIIIDDKHELHHMRRVLRFAPGDELDISDKTSFEYRTRIESLSEDEARLLILDKQKFAREPRLKITLYQGIPKGSKMDEIIQRSVELGVLTIAPVFMERTVVVDRGNFGKKLVRWQKISAEAVKQCRRGLVPQVSEPQDFAALLDELSNYDLVVFPYENEENYTLKDLLRQEAAGLRPAGAAGAGGAGEPGGAGGSDGSGGAAAGRAIKTVAVLIGPEGGFSEKEAQMLADRGIAGVSLGRTILRTETAGPAAIAMIMYELEM